MITTQVAPRIIRAEHRTRALAFWPPATFLINGTLFVLVGVELLYAVRSLRHADLKGYSYSREDVSFAHVVRMQYYGQLVDIEVDAPKPAIESAADVADLIAAFESTYQRMYARSARSPELGYLVAQVTVKGSVPIEKPKLPVLEKSSGAPPVKETRRVWWSDGWVETQVIEMTDVHPGHALEGPAILEAESTTFPIPPDRRAWLDEHGIFHLENKEA